MDARLAEIKEATLGRMIDKFRQMDETNDGMIDKSELSHITRELIPSVTDGFIEDLFTQCDKDQDGVISFSKRARGARHPAGPAPMALHVVMTLCSRVRSRSRPLCSSTAEYCSYCLPRLRDEEANELVRNQQAAEQARRDELDPYP